MNYEPFTVGTGGPSLDTCQGHEKRLIGSCRPALGDMNRTTGIPSTASVQAKSYKNITRAFLEGVTTKIP
jgi:hypothetical protein